jgi:hypothetical protein
MLLRAVYRRYMGLKLGVFWQTGRYMRLCSRRTEKGRFTGVFFGDMGENARESASEITAGAVRPLSGVLIKKNSPIIPASGRSVPCTPFLAGNCCGQ